MKRRSFDQSVKSRPNKKLAVAYARVSTPDQEKEGFSIPSQQTLYRDYAAERGISIVREFIDIETAKRVGRREFTKMDKFLREEATKPLEVACRIILVEKVDRLYRNFKDFVSVEELGVEIHFIKEHSVICPGSNSMEKFF